jgi:hypothetical protein
MMIRLLLMKKPLIALLIYLQEINNVLMVKPYEAINLISLNWIWQCIN